METNLIEEWRAVVGYEGLYEVSNIGNVRSLDRVTKTEGRKDREFFGRDLKPSTMPFGYKSLSLCKNGKSRSARVHRLVAEAFSPNPDSLPCVNHKDFNPANNHVSNLEWCDHAYNTNYSINAGRFDSVVELRKINLKTRGSNVGVKGRFHARSTPLSVIIDGEQLDFCSGKEMADLLGIDVRNLPMILKRGKYKNRIIQKI
jgi:hypothetical protein